MRRNIAVEHAVVFFIDMEAVRPMGIGADRNAERIGDFFLQKK